MKVYYGDLKSLEFNLEFLKEDRRLFVMTEDLTHIREIDKHIAILKEKIKNWEEK
jgi:hypothetical protein